MAIGGITAYGVIFNFVYSSSNLRKEALILSHSAGFGIIIARYPSLSAIVLF